mgnify:CR=1 FL=1|jgi:hypothetical protein
MTHDRTADQLVIPIPNSKLLCDRGREMSMPLALRKLVRDLQRSPPVSAWDNRSQLVCKLTAPHARPDRVG